MRRGARDLGPPPVPRFASEEHRLDDPHAFDHGGASAAPAPDGWGEAAPAAPSDEAAAAQAHDATQGHDTADAHEGWAEPEPTAHDQPAADPLHAGSEDELAPHAPWSSDNGADADVADAEATRVEDVPAHEADGDLGPPAPFFAPGAAPPAPAGNGPVVSPGPGEHTPAPIPRPLDDERGQTLPFWTVETEPRRRRFPRLPRLRRPTLRRPQLRRPTRAGLLRALPIVLLVIGGLLLVEGAVTVLWKEPFSAIIAASSQGALDDELEKLEREAAAQAARSRKEAVAYQRRRAVTLNREAGVGEAVGRLRIKKLGLNEVVVQGTDDTTIQRGPGHYMETPLPGQKGDWTVGIAGHRTTYGAPFRRINELKRGDQIVFSVPYGRFTYEVDRTKIVDAGYTEAMVPKGEDQIVLTACHPLYSAAQRILVYGKLTKSEPRGGARRAAAQP
jgi:sortase A